ncbi:hypothetical protein GCM10027285_05750 [Oleiagrimonas citrea]|uniref:hypothetical protein n=1 Tax=Oleiagrimonas citrea TaxID=1665687 RepID=UPI001964FFEE|nr:hypothetical protein [Oleiagrimonas citrea]
MAPDRFEPPAPVHASPTDGHARSPGVPEFIQPALQGFPDLMTRGTHGIAVKKTVFSPYWTPQHVDGISEWLQHLVDATAYHKTFDLGHGIRLHCASSLFGIGVAIGCAGDPPPPPSSKSGDARLSMAPAKPLAPGAGATGHARKASVRTPARPLLVRVDCETARVSGAPLPPHCARKRRADANATSRYGGGG